MSEDSAALQELLAAHQHQMDLIRTNGRKRFALGIVTGVGLGGVIIFAPPRYTVILGVAVAAWAAFCAWNMRPGRCIECRSLTGMAVPKDTYFAPTPWWDWRPAPRSDVDWVCPVHFGPYITERVGL